MCVNDNVVCGSAWQCMIERFRACVCVCARVCVCDNVINVERGNVVRSVAA